MKRLKIRRKRKISKKSEKGQRLSRKNQVKRGTLLVKGKERVREKSIDFAKLYIVKTEVN